MNRAEFDAWTRSLDSDEAPRALAALGIAAGVVARLGEAPERALDPEGAADLLRDAFRGVEREGSEPVPFRMDLDPFLGWLPASEWVEAWKRVDLPWGLRLEVIPTGARSPAWLVKMLGRPGVGASSVFVRVDHPAVDVTWSWPLRVGLLGDPASHELRSVLESYLGQGWWIDWLVTFVEAEAPDSDCDLLLMPHDARAALRRLTELPSPLYADCVILLSAGVDESDRTYGLLGAIRSAARTSGVAALDVAELDSSAAVGEDPRWRWLVGLVGELSHDAPIDVALWRSTSGTGTVPLLVAARRLVRQGRLLHHVRRMTGEVRIAGLGERTMMVAPGSATERVLEVPPGECSFERIAAAMHSRSSASFLRETDMATVAVEVGAAMEEASPGPRADPRFIQTQVSDASEPDRPVRRRRSLRAGAPHELAVRIGPADEHWLSPAPSQPFPDHELPPDQDEYDLTVVVADTRYRDDPQVGHVRLPRWGTSTTAPFWLDPVDEGVERVEWRIAVLYGNRVLQTALLRAPVGGDTDAGEGIELVVEALVRPALAELQGRSFFDGALIVNHASDGTAGVTGVHEDDARSFRVSDDLSAVIRALDDQLGEVAHDRRSFEVGFAGSSFEALLRTLAQIGYGLWRHIVYDGLRGSPVAQAPRLHVLSALPEARLPVEFIYDRDPPVDDAPLCPGADQALATGRCGDGCPSNGEQQDVVCPLGFWGISRVIERHAHDPELARDQVGSADFGFRAEPARARNTLELLKGAVIGSNYRVENTAGEALRAVCRNLTPSEDPVRTWVAWQDAVSAGDASLLVLIVHSEKAPNLPFPRLEIGTEDWVTSIHFNRRYLRPSEESPRPILLLLGCETGRPPVDFGGFIASARTHGAAIVVAAGAMIHSVHAVEVAEELVAVLRRRVADQPGITFGEVFLAARRDLLRRGRPMVLTLNAYGDADWHLS